MSSRPDDCQRQAGVKTRSKAESPEEKSMEMSIFPSISLLFPLFFFFLRKILDIPAVRGLLYYYVVTLTIRTVMLTMNMEERVIVVYPRLNQAKDGLFPGVEVCV
jgi:hypothetical protein